MIAGFAIIGACGRLWPAHPASDVAEFFVLRKYRRRGVGARAARQLFQRVPGRWEVRQTKGNQAATMFWRAVIAQHTHGQFEGLTLDDERWRGPAQVFES